MPIRPYRRGPRRITRPSQSNPEGRALFGARFVAMLDRGSATLVARLLPIIRKGLRRRPTPAVKQALSLGDWLGFVQALGRHGTDHWPGRTTVTRFGEKHVLIGPMPCPDGSAPQVLSVWMLSSDEAEAALVTAYPAP